MADCLFFDQYHEDLLPSSAIRIFALGYVLASCLGKDGQVLGFAPLRGETFDKFCGQYCEINIVRKKALQSRIFKIDVFEDYHNHLEQMSRCCPPSPAKKAAIIKNIKIVTDCVTRKK